MQIEHAGLKLFAIVDEVQPDMAEAGAYVVTVTLAATNIAVTDKCFWVTEAGNRLRAPIDSVRTTGVTKMTLRAFAD